MLALSRFLKNGSSIGTNFKIHLNLLGNIHFHGMKSSYCINRSTFRVLRTNLYCTAGVLLSIQVKTRVADVKKVCEEMGQKWEMEDWIMIPAVESLA